MSAIPRDRKEWDLGAFLNAEDGPDYLRDALSDEICRAIADMIQCGEQAEIGPYLIRKMFCDKSIAKAMAAEREAAEAQRELFAPHEDQFPSWERFTSRDPETGIALYGELS